MAKMRSEVSRLELAEHRLLLPDRIEMGTRRYYPARYEVVYDGLSLVVLVVIGLLVVFWP